MITQNIDTWNMCAAHEKNNKADTHILIYSHDHVIINDTNVIFTVMM